MDDTTPGVDDEATPGVDDDTPDTANESYEAKTEQTNVERTSVNINVCRHQRKKHNPKNYDNGSNITDETQKDGIILMQLK